MRNTERPFSPAEMRVAVLAILAAAAIAGLGLVSERIWSRPSLGEHGMAGYAASSLPDVLDARPMTGSL